MSKNTLFCLGLALAVLAISGCANTFNGAGRDMENMGDWMQDTF